MSSVLRIARKELVAFFASPAAFIFLAAFLVVTLFVFFWVETFFARNIADVRPLFEWMPILLIFLVSAMTMRMWSEERRMGTLEFLLTAPVNSLHFVLGKFVACLGLVAIALVLTLPLAFSVALLGNLDWGPVFGGYLATLFLAAAYASIGLFISARNDNQIVSLILTTVICGIFYLLGSDTLTALFGNRVGETFSLLGSGTRFESITRGVIDLRDLYYYASIVGVFLSLNLFALEKIRWAGNPGQAAHTRWRLLTGLFVLNFLAGNLWLQQVGWARVDMTQGKVYSISESTRSYLAQLREPLLIRGYFSAQTHPLLAPLVPRLRDLIQEYAIAGDQRVRVEFIDPLENPELEEEAGRKFGIKPVAFQTASKYQAAVVNSYFDIVIQYGDQHETLGFRDLIEVKLRSDTDIDVELRNPEYDITRAIKKVLYGYQGAGNPFANLPDTVTFKGYMSETGKLPEVLTKLRGELDVLLADLREKSQGRFKVEFADPDADGGALGRQLQADYGFQPMIAGLFNTQAFWFYMVLESGGHSVQVPLPEDLGKDGIQRGIEAALKRFAPGFLKTVALHVPEATPPMPQFGMMGGGPQFRVLKESLAANLSVMDADLKNGYVPSDADILMLLAPDKLDEKQLFAVDQFLMQGGTVVLASSPFSVNARGGLSVTPHDSGLSEWLKHHGIEIGKSMVLDPHNSAFPIPVRRNLGGFSVQEIQMVEYPYFVDVRDQGMNTDSGLTAGIAQLTMNWSSPIAIDAKANEQRKVIDILRSSAQAWTSASTDIQPDFQRHGKMGFAPEGEPASQLLAAVVEGRFDSFYQGKTSPLAKAEQKDDSKPPEDQASDEAKDEKQEDLISRVIERSPESARIILFASNAFLGDEALSMASGATGSGYTNTVQLIENAVDWSLEDRGLLGIRGRGHFSRVLTPLDRESQLFWEYLNYGLALLGLLLVYIVYRRGRANARVRYQAILAQGRA